jgi:eukaryotic-like serine/threonine-protein kinase
MEGPAVFQPDQVFGSYRLLHRLGAGGFSEVWLAFDEGPHDFRKKVALKLLPPTPDVHGRNFDALINEARVGCHLHHPHVVDMYRIGAHAGTWFIAMEYVEGQDLGRLLSDLEVHGVRLPRSALLDIALGVARALDYAHQAATHEGRPLRLVHRDIKPANVMLSNRGEIKVADFGIAKATTSLGTTTAQGQYKGTPAYSAPEAWLGQGGAHPRSDLFSLGAMLYEMATGERLFCSDDAHGVVARVIHGDPEPEADRVAEEFPALAPIVRDLLQREPDRRVQAAGDVVEALRELRRQVEAPCDLEFLIRLVSAVALPAPARSRELSRLSIPETRDDSWRRLFSLATSGPPAIRRRCPLEDTLDLGSAAGPGRPQTVSAELIPPTASLRPPAGPPAHPRRRLVPLLQGLAVLAALGLVLFVALGRIGGEPSEADPVREATPSLQPDTPTPATTPAPTTPTRADSPPITPNPTRDRTPMSEPEPAVAEPEPAAEDGPETAQDEAVGSAEQEAATTTGAVVFASKTTGEQIWIDGRKADFLARRSRPVCREYAPGPLAIRMGTGAAAAETRVEVRAGSRLVVECDLLVKFSCQVREEAGGCP